MKGGPIFLELMGFLAYAGGVWGALEHGSGFVAAWLWPVAIGYQVAARIGGFGP